MLVLWGWTVGAQAPLSLRIPVAVSQCGRPLQATGRQYRTPQLPWGLKGIAGLDGALGVLHAALWVLGKPSLGRAAARRSWGTGNGLIVS